jgi:hypothetical protein
MVCVIRVDPRRVEALPLVVPGSFVEVLKVPFRRTRDRAGFVEDGVVGRIPILASEKGFSTRFAGSHVVDEKGNLDVSHALFEP